MDARAAPPSVEKLDPGRARGVLIVLAAIAMMVMYVETMVIPGVPRFVVFFSAPISTVAWVLSAYLLIGVVSTPIFGKLGDIYGKKRILIGILCTYLVAVILAGYSPEIGSSLGFDRLSQLYLFIGMRGIQGVGMAMFPLAFAMIGEEFPPKEVAPAQGVISAMFAAGAAVGLFIGAYETESFGWQFTYHTVIPIAVLVLILALVVLRESRLRLKETLDIPGSAFLGISLGAGLLALTQGPTWGWGTVDAVTVSGVPLGVPLFAIVALLFAAAFILWEPRAKTPIVRFAKLKERNILVSNLNGLLVGTGMFLIFVANSIYTQLPVVGLGLNVFQSGALSVPGALSMLVTGPFLGKATSKFGPRPVMTLGFLLMLVGGLALASFNSVWWELAIFPIPIFVGMVSVMISMTNVIVVSSARQETGALLGMNLTFRNLGSSLGPVVATTILSSVTTVLLFQVAPGITISQTVPALAGFRDVYLLGAAFGALGAVLSLALRNYRYSADGTRTDDAARTPSAGATPAPTPATVRSTGE